jgi:hypothetical protein
MECGKYTNKHEQPSFDHHMVHSQLVFFDRDPSLWLTHTIPRASYGFAEPALLATRMALSMAGLATLVFFSCRPLRDAKYDRKDHGQ